MSASSRDPQRCPLCGGPNACGMSSGAGTCWCSSAKIPAEVLERVPPEARDQICVCAACASGERRPARPLRVARPDSD
ncbi:MAG TPA: cysteine-rich CWC family protein [Polyangiaceae bacterium]